MLDLYALYASGLALLRVNLLKTCGLWASGNLLLDFLLPQNESTDVGSYTRRQRGILINRVIRVLIEIDSRKKVFVLLNNFIG
jgi:hypothetical protein